MNLYKNIYGVDVFYLSGETTISYINEFKLFEDFQEKIELKSNTENKVIDLFCEDGIVLIIFSDGNSFIYSEEKLFAIPDSSNSIIKCGKTSIYEYDYEVLDLSSNIYDIKSSKRILSKNLIGKILILDCKISLNLYKDEIKLVFENEVKWNYKLAHLPSYLDVFHNEKPADVQQILGIYNKILWIHVGGDRLIGLDINTGKLLHNFDNVLLGEEGNAFLDTENGVIKSLWLHQYIEFNLNAFNISKIIKNIGKSEKLSIHKSTFYIGDSNLYFCGYYDNSDFPSCFGVFDTNSCDITFLETSKSTSYFNPPQANSELLAILDDNKTLLVYKKE